MRIRHLRLLPSLLVVSAALLLALPAAAEWQRFEIDGKELTVGNLVGHVECIPHEGSNFIVEAQVRGDDADEFPIEFETGDDFFFAHFPVDDVDSYVYAGLGRGSRSTVSFSGRNRDGTYWATVRDRGARKIEVRGRGRGAELWVDLRVHVPRDGSLVVQHGIGDLEAQDLFADVELHMMSGPIEASRIEGNLLVDTGSGHVELFNWKGETLEIDTGSGSVEVSELSGQEVKIDTGSGSVKVEDLSAFEIEIDTGSGSVDARRVHSGRMLVDTGSGSVRLDLLHVGDGPYEVDTGSGGISLHLPADASVEVSAETGSGGIRVDVDGADYHRKKRDEVEFTLGAGKTRVQLETGSGTVRIDSR